MPHTPDPEPLDKKNNQLFPLVAIGGAEGGLKAAKEFFAHLPEQTGMAFLYIQYPEEGMEPGIAEAISEVTRMKVQEARHLMPVEPDHVYIISVNKEFILIDGVLALNPNKEAHDIPMPIDRLFSSVADKYKEAAIGIILSGSVNDGTLGLKKIKLAGGITMAQDQSATFQTMPKSAISEEAVDMSLSPQEMAREMEELSQKTDLFAIIREENENEPAEKDLDIKNILQLVKKSTGVDFFHYKLNTIKRRIVRRMLLHKLENTEDYVQYIKQHANEVNLLYKDLLINVTTFFRDPDTLEYLKKTIIPRILKNKKPNDPLRIWVPACSTGEEAYSLAIILIELLGDKAPNIAIQIFATDLSESAIVKARLGIYSRNDLLNVSPKRLQRFFTKTDSNYRIAKSIRDLCVFAPRNVFKDPPFIRMDLISCCNLMIYLDPVLQKKVLNTFHYALNLDGYLVLGKSESIGNSAQLFTLLEKKFKVFSRKGDVSNKATFDLNYRFQETERSTLTTMRKPTPREADHSADLEKMVDNILLSKYIPASIVVNQELEILQFRGPVGLYLEPSPGKASLNLLKMAKPSLALELRNTIHKAGKDGNTVKRTGLEVKTHDKVMLVQVEVSPLKSDSEERLFLVIFEQMHVPETLDPKSPITKDKLVQQLEEELKALREDMRSIIEEQEASNEELQSANEEIVSSNEELQSINEELETSKEELESTNEELMTINAELQVRNDQLAEAYEYAEMVFDTIREGILILDKDLRIQSANRSFYRIFNVKTEELEGILLFEMNHGAWDIPELRELVEIILHRQTQFFGLKIQHSFPGVGNKILLLNACRYVQKSNQTTILIAIEDVTECSS
jgi:two-component system CheB/CheR fusion protein